MEYCYYANTSIGYLNNIITTEIERGIASLNRYIQLINGITMILVYVSFASIINYRMTILVLVLSIFMFVILRRLSWISRKLSLLVSETNAHIQSLLIQTIYNFKYLKATDSFTHIHKHLFKNIDNNFMYKFRGGVLSAFSSSIVEPLAVLLMSGLILYSVGYQGKSIAGIFVLLLFFYKAFVNVFSFQSQWQGFNATLGGLETIIKANKILGRNIEVSGSKHIKSLNRAIELRDVNYSYDSRQVLFNINMSIPRNKSIGIVGESGAGKTTLFDIITGMLKPQSGKICIDGIDYLELEFSSLRNIIGYVTQEPVIFNDTIANNISFWECDSQEGIRKERIKDAAILANCDRFINETEKGCDTVIGDKGVKLSGGQRQRIAIARELFKEPEIMIFDEATSSLDTESEQLIQQSINSLKGERTVVIIAHRLSTVRNCDYIYVLKDGRIAEEGSFNKLYRDEKSSFYNMCQAQNL
jgi:subfamily B ATP-binding cassette protein MsbA